jgi:hypothetical protein
MTNVLIFDKNDKHEGYIYVTGIPCVGDIDKCLESSENKSLLAEISPMKVFGYEPSTINTPRIFEFPYTPENREMFAKAAEHMGSGGRSVLRHGKPKNGEGDGDGQEGEIDGTGKAQKGEGTPNSQTEGADDIYVDNEALKGFVRKDQPQ